MKARLKQLVTIINTISFIAMLLIGAVGVVFEIIGAGMFERLFSSIGVPNALTTVQIAGVIAIALAIITFLIKQKFFDDK